MPKGKSNKSTPTKARVIFSENSPSNTTTGKNTSSNTETTASTSAMDTADGLRMTDTTNQIFSEKTIGNSQRKKCHFKRGESVRHPQR